MIRLADTSEVGRASVEEYEMNPLGSDSYYCKRIHQSEPRIIKKRNKSHLYTPTNVNFNSGQLRQNQTLYWKTRQNLKENSNNHCFGCDEQGYWQSSFAKRHGSKFRQF